MVDTTKIKSGFRSRTELLAQRKHERRHVFDKYDLDGDGVVSNALFAAVVATIRVVPVMDSIGSREKCEVPLLLHLSSRRSPVYSRCAGGPV